MPRPGAANGVVPKNGIGIAFWIAGVPGSADMVNVEVPSAIAAGIKALRNRRCAKQFVRHWREHEKRDEKADAAVGDQRARENHGKYRALRTQAFGHVLGDRRYRAAVFHQLAEQRAKKKDRKELHDEARRTAHERLRPMGEQRLAGQSGGQDRGEQEQAADAPALDKPARSAARGR